MNRISAPLSSLTLTAALAAVLAAGGCRRATAYAASPRPSDDLSRPAAASGFCASLCARSAPLRCVAAVECPAFCGEMLRSPVCHAEMQTALDCFAAQPIDSWVCDVNGLPTIAAGPCDAAQEAYRACRKLEGPSGG